MGDKDERLGYLEFQIAKLERRIKTIKENPDPTKPKSNLLLYEMERDDALTQLKDMKEGKTRHYLALEALGLNDAFPGATGWGAIIAADRSAGPLARKYFDIIKEEGMAEHTCDRTIVLVPMVLRGDYPKPSYVMVANWECMPIYLSYLLIAQRLNIPYFVVDRKFVPFRPLEDDKELKYVTDQLGEMIEDIEAKVPGLKYNEDILMEIQHHFRQCLKYEQEQWKLRAAIPCPIAPKESFRELLLRGSVKGVEYVRTYTEELAEKVAKGESGLPQGVEERLRFLWSNTGPFHHDPFTWLGEKGVSIPASLMTVYEGWRSGREPIWGDPWHGRKLTPLEEEARQLDYVWGRLGEHWVQNHINVCRDLKMDGIVYFLQWGCTVTNNLGSVVAETAERELGIPTLLIEGRQLDETSWDENDFLGRLEEFIEIALEAKKRRALRRQDYGE